jgi:acetyl esterase/lipase
LPEKEHIAMSMETEKEKELAARGALLYWAVLFMISAAVMHFVAVLKQLPPSGLLAVLLIGFTIVQVVVAVSVVAVPTRRLLFIAGLVEAVGTVVWLSAHSFGLPDGFTVWRPETLGVPDLYLPIIEGVSAFFFLCLCGRTWTLKRGVRRTALKVLPSLLVLGLLVWIALKSVSLVVVFLAAGPVVSLQFLFLPAVGLLAVFLLLRLLIPRLRVRTKGAWRTALILLPALLVSSLLIWGGSVSAIDTPWLSASALVSVPAGQTATLTYCNSSNGSPLAMDISEPSAQASRPAPVAIYIHGGETLLGSRVLEDGSLDGMYFTQLRTELLSHGFIVGSLDYGLVPLYNVREQARNAKCAVRFLRAHANELGIDPHRIGVYGPSQGGYISAMLGTVGQDVGYDVGQYLNQSSSVQAVVDMWGPTDISNFSGSPGWASLLVGHGTTAQLHNASPAYHVAHGDPPFLIMHGTDDWFIAPHHSQDMAKRLHAAGVPVTLVMIQHDGHGLAMPTSGQIEQPGPDVLVHMIVDFFSSTLAA